MAGELVKHMEYYFDTEVALDAETLEREAAGEKITLSPENCKIITMQFQLLDSSGMPASPLMIMKEWETPGGEEGMIRRFMQENFSSNPWEFIPVGCNVLFDLGLLRGRAEEYGIEMGVWELYHQRPFIDIKHILLGMNGFAFRESGLDKFCGKRNGREIPVWYQLAQKGDAEAYRWIEEYVEEEAAEFVALYSRLKSELPKLRSAMGLFNGAGARKGTKN
ncbi:Uncharacterised protein [Candidatus Burarchaeum australiense]|nr:Uncharacterised protein [Candidatus Burarchaeum australiense]